MSAVLYSGQVHLRPVAAQSLIWCVALYCLVAGRAGWGEAQEDTEPRNLDHLEFMMVGTWQDKEVPRPDPDSVYTFQVSFTVAMSGTAKTLPVSAADLKGKIVTGDRLLLTGYSDPVNKEVTFRVHAMTPSAERLVAELSGLPAEAKDETCCGRLAIPICAAQLSSEDLSTRMIAHSGFVGWVQCAQIQAAKDVPLETLQKLSREKQLGRRVHETAALLLAAKSPADPADLIRLIRRLRDEGGIPTFHRDRTLSQAYLTALREKGIPTFLNDEKWSDPPVRRKLVHVAIDTLEEAKRPFDRKIVLAFCEESLKLEDERISAILTLQRARFWDIAPRLKQMFQNGPFEENRSSRISLRSYITQFVLTWRDSADPNSASYREAAKMLEEFEKIDAEAVEFSKSYYRPPGADGEGC